jgi:CoA:oxalate CoA-transferase
MSLPLDGVVVIDLSQIYNGPYATFLLATSGATVIKVEPPGGESLRRRARSVVPHCPSRS